RKGKRRRDATCHQTRARRPTAGHDGLALEPPRKIKRQASSPSLARILPPSHPSFHAGVRLLLRTPGIMASTSVSPHSPPLHYTPTLKHYLSTSVFLETNAHTRTSSRPSSSSSSSSYASSSGTIYTTSPASSRSGSWCFSPVSPSGDSTHRRPRPLPTPPATPDSARGPLPPRPLPSPPPFQAHRTLETRPAKLPIPPSTPPTPRPPRPVRAASVPTLSFKPEPSPSVYSISMDPSRSTSVASTAKQAPSSTGRPSIQLLMPSSSSSTTTDSTPPSLPTPSPLSPIAFDFSGPSDQRRRREEELERRMRDMGFVEATPRKRAHATSGSVSRATGGRHTPAFSVSYGESDEERDVVLLVDHQSDAEDDAEPPTRSESRAAMLTLFSNAEDEIELVPQRAAPLSPPPPEDVADVQVEVVTKEAVARTKRRFSRKWVREKGGKRWTTKDFSEVISELRKLR
ncbi:hypothetical protein C8Q79DRAFT_1037181, partial [Trametes meyenii]